jgi:TetR/AcrR family transcriptional regulator, cholesterol catabolism regulator
LASASLREQQAAVARERILDAVAKLIERDGSVELTMPQVAELAGVSLRTVYRYYPTREELVAAAGRWIGGALLKQGYPKNLDDVADSFERACSDFDERPGLVRAMALSALGRAARSPRRSERLDAIRQALEQEVGELPEGELRQAEAVLAYLHNMLAYTTLRDEQQLSGEEIGQALGWAIRTLVGDLRCRQRMQRRKR